MTNNSQISTMLTVREVTKLLHVHSNTLRRWSDLGIVKAYRIGPRGDRRFRPEDIAMLLLEENRNSLMSVDKLTPTDKTAHYAMSR